jgi:hypothetical protein
MSKHVRMHTCAHVCARMSVGMDIVKNETIRYRYSTNKTIRYFNDTVIDIYFIKKWYICTYMLKYYKSANDLDLKLGRWGHAHVNGGDMVKVCAKYGRSAMKTD